MRTVLYTVLLAALTAVASAFPTGSPVCVANATTLLAVPNTPMGKQGDLGFSLAYAIPNNQTTAGQQYKISVAGNGKFQGLLLWSLAADKTHPGQFNLPNGFKYVTTVPCPGDPKGTVTHTDASSKPATDFMWTAPMNSSVKQVQFVAVVVGGTPPQFQVIKDGRMFNVVSGPAGASNTTTSTNSTNSTNSTSSTNSGTDPNSGNGSGTSTGTDPTDTSAASSSSNSTTSTPSSDAQSLKGTPWILVGSTTLLVANFLVALI